MQQAEFYENDGYKRHHCVLIGWMSVVHIAYFFIFIDSEE